MSNVQEATTFETDWEKAHPIDEWKESNEAEFWYYLEVLPPLHWHTTKTHTLGVVESFKCSEPMDHREAHPGGVFTCCAKLTSNGVEKFYVSYQGWGTTSKQIADQLFDAIQTGRIK